MIIRLILALLFLITFFNPSIAGNVSSDQTQSISLGRIMPFQTFSKTIAFENTTPNILNVHSIELPFPFLARGIPQGIKPGSIAEFTLQLSKNAEYGLVGGIIRLNFKEEQVNPIEFEIEAYLVPPIEFSPQPVAFLSTQRGKTKISSIEVINHRTKALDLIGLEYNSERFKSALHTIAPGKHYRIDLTILGKGEAGRKSEWLRIINNDKELPTLRLMVNTLVKEKVYTFPESVDLGGLPLNVATDPDATSQLAQILMIYKPGAIDFEISASTSLDNIHYTYERGPKGDRFQFNISLVPEEVKVGPIKGTLLIKTNDKEFPVLEVPVNGEILP